MYSVTKWMLVAALIGANGDGLAREQPYNLDRVAGDTNCRAPFVCMPEVRPDLKGLLTSEMHTSPEGGSQGRAGGFLLLDDVGGTPGSVGYRKSNHGRFACGEVVGRYTVTCTRWPTGRAVSAPDIDTSAAVGGVMFVMGCLAILHGRRRRLADGPAGR